MTGGEHLDPDRTLVITSTRSDPLEIRSITVTVTGIRAEPTPGRNAPLLDQPKPPASGDAGGCLLTDDAPAHSLSF